MFGGFGFGLNFRCLGVRFGHFCFVTFGVLMVCDFGYGFHLNFGGGLV